VNRVQSFPASARLVSILLVVVLVAGCAKVNTNDLRRYKGLRLPSPQAIVVYDFEPTGTEIGLAPGQTGGESGLGISQEEMEIRREVGRVLADVVAKELENRGIVTTRQSGTVRVPEASMAIGGQVISVDEGSGAKRIFIGFGSGRSRLSTVGQLYGKTDGEMADLWGYQNTAASGAKPGVLTTLPIGIAVQGLTLFVLLLNGGLSTLGALSSTSTANAKRMGKEMAGAVEDTLFRITVRD
jgi:hypothetical protein